MQNATTAKPYKVTLVRTAQMEIVATSEEEVADILFEMDFDQLDWSNKETWIESD